MFVLLWLDWVQTTVIANNPHKWSELNPILGPHPDPSLVTVYFAIVAALALAFIHIRHKLIFPSFCVMLVIQATCVLRNAWMGVQ